MDVAGDAAAGPRDMVLALARRTIVLFDTHPEKVNLTGLGDLMAALAKLAEGEGEQGTIDQQLADFVRELDEAKG